MQEQSIHKKTSSLSNEEQKSEAQSKKMQENSLSKSDTALFCQLKRGYEEMASINLDLAREDLGV